MNKEIVKRLFIVAVFAGSLILSLFTVTKSAYADCYGGGDECIVNKSFSISKKVRVEGDNEWKDKVTNVKEGDIIEFKVEIKNTGDLETDDMEMKDYLPDELVRTGGFGLTEYWDNFAPGDSKTFKIKAMIKSSEFESENFDKCVVNKAKVSYKNHDEGSNTATVCYNKGAITELPKTGATANNLLTVLGIGSIGLGLAIKKFKVYLA